MVGTGGVRMVLEGSLNPAAVGGKKRSWSSDSAKGHSLCLVFHSQTSTDLRNKIFIVTLEASLLLKMEHIDLKEVSFFICLHLDKMSLSSA